MGKTHESNNGEQLFRVYDNVEIPNFDAINMIFGVNLGTVISPIPSHPVFMSLQLGREIERERERTVLLRCVAWFIELAALSERAVPIHSGGIARNMIAASSQSHRRENLERQDPEELYRFMR